MRILLPVLLAACAASFPSRVVQAQPAPPHSFLFGTWTGGLFPPPANVTATSCLGTPVVIITRDVVLRATLTQQVLSQREIATARAEAEGFEITFAATGTGPTGLLGAIGPQPGIGFGCPSNTLLPVQRRGENEISFPGCSDFPYPLLRCPSR